MDNPLPEEPLDDNPEFSGDSNIPDDGQELEFEENLEADEASTRKPKPDSEYSVMNGVQTVVSIALVMATLLTLWSPRKIFQTPNLSSLVEAEATEAAIVAQNKYEQSSPIGILAGHYGEGNPGEVCADGTKEADLNYDIATLVKEKLEAKGFTVELFPESDPKLLNFTGEVMIALYSGSCASDPLPPSGFKVGGSISSKNPDQIDRLATCISQEYQAATQLPFTYEVIGTDNAAFHVFRDISPDTAAVLLEMGSMKTDRKVLVDQSDKTADGIVAGIVCYING
jgi:N-acetylmuramoyl-L-alanine amidase